MRCPLRMRHLCNVEYVDVIFVAATPRMTMFSKARRTRPTQTSTRCLGMAANQVIPEVIAASLVPALGRLVLSTSSSRIKSRLPISSTAIWNCGKSGMKVVRVGFVLTWTAQQGSEPRGAAAEGTLCRKDRRRKSSWTSATKEPRFFMWRRGRWLSKCQ